MKKIILIMSLLIPLNTFALADNAKSAILMDFNTGTILYEKNSNEKRSMASMTKMMSLLIVMEKLDDKSISLNDDVYISNNASKMGGSQVFLEENTSMKLETLLKAVTIASANDAITALAEYIAGSTDQFVDMMNNKAKELNLSNTNFTNVHGLDEDNHYSSAYDMAIIALNLLKHKNILNYTSIYEDYIKHANGKSTWIVNTNKLINYYNGLDGLKTGYTKNSGYCITATAKKNNMRLISVVMGEETSVSRTNDTIELLNYGFSKYKIDSIINKEKFKYRIKVNFGLKEFVDAYLKNNVENITDVSDNRNYKYEIIEKNNIAPIKKNDIVGEIIIYDENKIINKYDLLAKHNVNKSGYIYNFFKNMKKFL